MNHRLIEALMTGIAPIIRDFLAQGLSAVEARLKALESREIVKGEKGDLGDKGERGEAGEKGEAGETGPQGEKGDQGEPGQQGVPGSPGEKGETGEKGLDGAAGRDGQPGRDGLIGAPGEKGIDGKDGRDGIDGKDGLGFDDLTVEFDGERTATLKFARGDQIKTFDLKFPITIDRGVWKERAYERGDVVTWAGSSFIAQRDNSDKPETSDAWRLAVKRGRDGKDGKNGERGLQGLKGERGETGQRGYGG